MAAKKESAPEVSLESNDPNVPKPRLVKLIVKNFRCIGPASVEIELDDIVILVGANNVGKSSILRAYKLAMSQGSVAGRLALDDFPNGQIDPANLPQIEVQTVVYDDTVGKRWVDESSGERIVRECWTWSQDGADPQRQGWDANDKGWADKVPWGAPGYANSRRPEPYFIDAFDNPDSQAKEIVKLLRQELDSRLKAYKADGDSESEYSKLLKQLGKIQKKIVDEAQEQIQDVNVKLTELVQLVFPDHRVDFDARPEENLDDNVKFFKSDSQLLMGPEKGHMSTIQKQGSGARRTLLWTAIKFLAENTRKVKSASSERPHLLLMDEPEICLHPNAIREACKALYSLPSTGKWQVMATTHSPIFIDFSQNNTTIVRVEKTKSGDIEGTTVFRPSSMSLSDDDKENLKLLNICDPYVAEFFFGGKIVIVEGDTEYTAFKYIISQNPELYRDVHIIRARGKYTIVSLVKVLNHFNARYSILHDMDNPLTKKNTANSAWAANGQIISEASPSRENDDVRVYASLPNFEEAYFGLTSSDEKPYKALKAIMEDKTKYEKIGMLLDVLVGTSNKLPANCVKWFEISELQELV